MRTSRAPRDGSTAATSPKAKRPRGSDGRATGAAPKRAARPGAVRAVRSWFTAGTADPLRLYELAVQEPQAECDFIDATYRARTRTMPSTLREDFCASHAVCREWVCRRRTNRAWGIDLDGTVLAWGKQRQADLLTPDQRSRIALSCADVLTARREPVDVTVAMNFSYFIFKTRPQLLAYFKAALKGIRRGGMFACDAYGGSGSFVEQVEPRDLDGFTYEWDQSSYNPITGEVVNHIHFSFPDRTRLTRAFTYDWRLWSLPEVQELLVEAGFRDPVVHWEGTAPDGSGDGVFRPSRRGEACEAWIAYITAWRP